VQTRSLLFTLLLTTLCPLANASQQNPASAPVSDFPKAARAGISAALGHDMPDYYAHAAQGGFESANPRHKLGARFTAEGVVVKSGEASWQMKFVGYGYGSALISVKPAAPQAEANRVAYRRGPVTEWYLNGPVGMEQGFTLTERPGGEHGGPLTIALAMGGNLTAAVEDNVGLLLESRNKHERLRYGGLTAYDSTGRKLGARLELRGDLLLIKIEDKEARYPVVIDPLVQLAELTASDGIANDSLGVVAISGSTVIVGAVGYNNFQGAVYVFVKPATGWVSTSTYTAKLTASDGAAGDDFGQSVAISGNAVVVGAFGGNAFQGAAYVFVKPATGWVTTSTFNAKLTASDGKAGDLFGENVSVSGGTVIAGANRSNSGQGAAYVFVKPTTGWASTSAFTAKLTSPDTSASLHFGFSVCVTNNTIVVTSDEATIGGNSNQGAAYVFLKPSGGWVTTSASAAKLTASDGAASDLFGYSASFGSNVLVIGLGRGLGGIGSGAAYVFVKPTTGWATTSAFNAKLTNGKTGDFFGGLVAISGNSVLVGAPDSNLNKGAAYLYVKPASGWATTSKFKAKLIASDGAAGDSFGWVAISGGNYVVGAPFHNGSQGSAYVFGP